MRIIKDLRILLFAFALQICVVGVAQTTLSGLDPSKFSAFIDGKQTALYTLKNVKGEEACITNYGARLVSLHGAQLEWTNGRRSTRL